LPSHLVVSWSVSPSDFWNCDGIQFTEVGLVTIDEL
jgi:hypothetical protein